MPKPGKTDPFFGLTRGFYYQRIQAGDIRSVSLRQRGKLKGCRLIDYDSVLSYVRRMQDAQGEAGV